MTLHIIFGPTASSKSKTAFALWKQYRYPILSVDSRKVYKGADIGTNKYTMLRFIEENPSMVVGGIDFLSPNEAVSVYIYQQYAYKWITEHEQVIRERGGLIIHGGTGLYLDALLEGRSLLSQKNEELRNSLKDASVAQLQERANTVSPTLLAGLNQSDRMNPRRLIRVIEHAIAPEKETPVVVPAVLTDLQQIWHLPQISRELLYPIINARVETYFSLGWMDEVRSLHSTYGADAAALQMMGYKQLLSFLQSTSDCDKEMRDGSPRFIAMVADIQQEHRRYAKRQETWAKKYLRRSNITLAASS